MITTNKQIIFDRAQKDNFGLYVYALQDPFTNEIFYIGQGQGERMLNHASDAGKNLYSKKDQVNRINEINRLGGKVKYYIAAYGLTKLEADKIESSLHDILNISKNGKCLNKNTPPNSTFLDEYGILKIRAPYINPNKFLRVFIFSIKKSRQLGDDIYEATRKTWTISEKYRNQKDQYYAVGLVDNISMSAYKIDKWECDGSRCSFIGQENENSEQLINFNWKYIIESAKGYWARGQYLIVQFDGEGHFNFLRGSKSSEWIKLIPATEL